MNKSILTLILILCSNLFLLTEKTSAYSSPRSYFLCDLKVQDQTGRRVLVDIQQQPVILGVGEYQNDLQPVFVGDWVTETFRGQIRMMGNILENRNDNSVKLKLGIYNMQKNLDRERNIHLWSPPQGDRMQSWVAKPIYESVSTLSEDDSLEINVGNPISGGNTRAAQVHYSCKLTR